MKKEMARCGLACFLCSENTHCSGCHADDCAGAQWCEVRKCCMEKGYSHCYKCDLAETCQKGILANLKPHVFTLFAKRYGENEWIACLERNRQNGIVYHRNGIRGDYDDCKNREELMKLIREGKHNGS